MSRRRFSVAVLAAALAALVVSHPLGAANEPARASVGVDPSRISTKLGQKFSFRSTIVNDGQTPVSGLIAHLNVLSLRNGVYVDPEDWSSNRTRYLDTIPADGSITTTWRMQAVNDGVFGIYVAYLPASGIARPPTATPTIRLDVASRKTLNAGGMLPLALGIPAVLGALSLGVRIRRRG